MKTRITLTMDAKRVAKLRALSRRRKMSVGALVERMTDRLPDHEDASDLDWVEGLKGAITGRISEEEVARDPRLARILRK